MAKREYVKDLSSVTRLSDELKDIFTGWEDELDNISVAEMKIIKNAEKVVKEFAKSTKYSEESLDYASHISKLLLQDVSSIRERNNLLEQTTEEVEEQKGLYEGIKDVLKDSKDIISNGIVKGLQNVDDKIGGIGSALLNFFTSPCIGLPNFTFLP